MTKAERDGAKVFCADARARCITWNEADKISGIAIKALDGLDALDAEVARLTAENDRLIVIAKADEWQARYWAEHDAVADREATIMAERAQSAAMRRALERHVEICGQSGSHRAAAVLLSAEAALQPDAGAKLLADHAAELQGWWDKTKTMAADLAAVVARKDLELAAYRKALEEIGGAKSNWQQNVGSYAGGETWYGFACRLQKLAEAALQSDAGKRTAEAERDAARQTKTIICTAPGESLSQDDLQVVAEYAEFLRFRRALENIYMLARRERRKSAEAQAGAWDHIVRFCREAGLKTSVLRSEATVNEPEKEATLKTAVETAEAAKRDTARLFWLETSGAWAWAEWYINRGIQPDGLGLRAAIDAAMEGQ